MPPQDRPDKSETLWDVHEQDRKPQNILNEEVDYVRANPQAQVMAYSPDWFWKLATWSVGGFFLLALIIFGGRDVLLLTGSKETQATLVTRHEVVNCPTRYNRGTACQKITFRYMADGKPYDLDITVELSSEPHIRVKYVTWAPSIYKTY